MTGTPRNARLRALALASLVAASVALSRQAPRLEISPDDVLIDESFRIVLTGVPADADVTIRVDGNGGLLQSAGTFRSNAQGRVEVSDPAPLLWSVTRKPGAAPAPGGRGDAQPWVFTAEVGGKAIAARTITRRMSAANVRMAPVRERGLVGTAYYPAESGRHPAIVVLAGAIGGLPAPGAHPAGLASRGYIVLALAYFNAEGLPPLIKNIPLEYFATAVDWLKSQPLVDPARIGVLGTSRGGELALLLGATFPPAFRVVVANVPGSVVWPGMSDDSDTPAWTLAGTPLPHVPMNFTAADQELSGRDRFLKRLQHTETVRRAEIPVERIRAPILMFSGKDDQSWPSDVFADRIVNRLKEHKFAYPVEHYSYENAGHLITRPHVPTWNVREVTLHPVSKRPNMPGGTPEGQGRANADSWAKLLTFLEKYLR